MTAHITTRMLEAETVGAGSLAPVQTIKRRWPVILSAVLTAAMVVMLGRELLNAGLAGLRRAVPDSPWFYLAFAGLYLAPPLGDYIIFRRLWRIPLDGFVALNKKRIANDVVLGYSGEAYFYAWARTHARTIIAPFGAVKDVSLLSAIAGNAATILLCALALPIGYSLMPPPVLEMIAGSAALTVAISTVILLFAKRVFSLARRDLWWIFAIHAARIVAGSVLVALAWHFAMPDVSISMWLFLAAGRLLVSRLPLVPNKDLLFASFAILVIGHDRALTEMIAFTSALTLIVHVALIAAAACAAGVRGVTLWRG